MLYVVMAIGCMECGVPTNIIGVFDNEEKAIEVKKQYLEIGDSWNRFGGDGYVGIFESELNQEYWM